MNRWGQTGLPFIEVHGVGVHVVNNHLHDSPHTLISYEGNEHIFEYNRLHDACTQTGDSGALYSGRDWTRRGIIIRHNFIYRVRGPGLYGTMALFFDDQVSTALIEGNIIYDTFKGVFIGGGR